MTQTEQVRPKLCHPDQQRPVTASQSRTARCTPQGDIQLVSEKKVLQSKLAPRPEQVADKDCKQMEDRDHRAASCDDSASSRESADEIFGNDNRPQGHC